MLVHRFWSFTFTTSQSDNMKSLLFQYNKIIMIIFILLQFNAHNVFGNHHQMDGSNRIHQQYGIAGNSATLICNTSTLALPSRTQSLDITWKHNGQIVQNSSDITQTGSILWIKSIDRVLHGGLYVCLAKNPNGNNENHHLPSVRLVVIENSAIRNQKENEPAVLSCPRIKQTNPLSSDLKRITWMKDNKIIRTINLQLNGEEQNDGVTEKAMIRDDYRISVSSQNGSLMISSVIPNDQGFYECFVTRDDDTVNHHDSGTLFMEVIEELKFVPPPASKQLELHSVGKIHCRAQGSPTPQIKWQLNQLNKNQQKDLEDRNGTLTFRNVSMDHVGNYTCRAHNSQGEISATIVVTVVISPKFTIKPKANVNVVEMSTIWLDCQATGDPKPQLHWDKDGKYLKPHEINGTNFHIFPNGTLRISEIHLTDSAKYGCTIGSNAGLKREESRVIVKNLGEFMLDDDERSESIITKTVLVTISIALAYIILVVALMYWCRIRRRTRKLRLDATDGDNDGGDNVNIEMENCLLTKEEKQNGNATNHKKFKSKLTNGDANKLKSGENSQKSDDTNSSKGSKKSTYDKLAIDRSALYDIIKIGKGSYGEIFVGKVKNTDIPNTEDLSKMTTESDQGKYKISLEEINEIKKEGTEKANGDVGKPFSHILVKSFTNTKDDTAHQEFRNQIDMFRSISHRGVSKLFGLCLEMEPHYMVLEYTDWGDLKQFLLATAGVSRSKEINGDGKDPKKKSSPPPLNTPQILALAHQTARAMDIIYRSRFIHKDLATRNCIISSNFVVKVCYPALCKDKYSKEYFKYKNMTMPLRWMAPECIDDDDYSTKSDVYAFGVFVWELFTRSINLPLSELSDNEFLVALQNHSLERNIAPDTPSDLQKIMMTCWKQNPKDRPSFTQLYSAFGKSLQQENATTASNSSS